MAEKVRFELTVLAYTRVPGVHLKPLGHLSLLCSSARRQNSDHIRGAIYLYREFIFDNRKLPSVLKKLAQELAAFFGEYATGE